MDHQKLMLFMTCTSSSFKYKVELLGNPVLDGNIAKGSVKVVVPLKYLSNFSQITRNVFN